MDKVVIGAILMMTIAAGLINHVTITSLKSNKQSISNGSDTIRLVTHGNTFCSGSVLDDTTIITAAHCVVEDSILGFRIKEDPIEIRAADNLPRGTSGWTLSAEPRLDLGVIKGNFKIYNKFKIIDSPLGLDLARKETYFYSCGFPLGYDLYCIKLTYKDVYEFGWKMKGLILPGMSGGPVFTINGYQVGVNSAVQSNFSLVSPIYHISKISAEPPRK